MIAKKYNMNSNNILGKREECEEVDKKEDPETVKKQKIVDNVVLYIY